jgi:Asp-tRNA(Asn)/Glu-tRNA(Gln) amidotransferase A subunit family amidase
MTDDIAFLPATELIALYNLTKNPSASISGDFVDGLPVGLMVTGSLYGDLEMLQACRTYEEAEGAAWPPAGLRARLAAIAAVPGAGVAAKLWHPRA